MIYVFLDNGVLYIFYDCPERSDTRLQTDGTQDIYDDFDRSGDNAPMCISI